MKKTMLGFKSKSSYCCDECGDYRDKRSGHSGRAVDKREWWLEVEEAYTEDENTAKLFGIATVPCLPEDHVLIETDRYLGVIEMYCTTCYSMVWLHNGVQVNRIPA